MLISKFEDELVASIVRQLDGWSGPHVSERGDFWHCRDRDISIWEDPTTRLTEAVELARSVLCRGWLDQPRTPDGKAGLKSPGNSRASTPRSFGTAASVSETSSPSPKTWDFEPPPRVVTLDTS